MILDASSNWLFYDSMTYFALKVIDISGSLQQSWHAVTSLQALRTIEDSVTFMCICHPCHFLQYWFRNLKFSLDHTWQAMVGSDDTEHYISSAIELCHAGRKQFSWHMKAFFFADSIKVSVHCKKGRVKVHRLIWLLSV